MVCTRRKVLFDWGKNTMEKVIKTKRGFNDTKKYLPKERKRRNVSKNPFDVGSSRLRVETKLS